MEPVTVQLDAISDRQFSGKLTRIGTIASSDFSAGWPIPRNFDLEISLDQTEPRLKPGMTVQVAVIVDRVPDVITIPAQATFLKSGQNIAFVWDGSTFQERVIQVERRSRDRILVSKGLRSGDLVALLPVDEHVARDLAHYGEMPLRSLMKDLAIRTGGRVARNDEGATPKDSQSTLAPIPGAPILTSAFANQTDLWFEYTVATTQE